MRPRLIRAPLWALVGFVALGVLWRWASRRRSLPFPTWLAWLLDNPLADWVGGTQTTLDRIGLRAGEHGLDAGCGPGRLSLPALHRVGPTGSVTALDLQPAMVARVEQRAAGLGLSNLRTLVGNCTQPGLLSKDAYDRAWLVTVLGEIPDRIAALRQIHRALKPGGVLAVTEVFGIDPHDQSPETVLQLGTITGFESGARLGPWWSFTQLLVRPGKVAVMSENDLHE